jgi:hypothetical protein
MGKIMASVFEVKDQVKKTLRPPYLYLIAPLALLWLSFPSHPLFADQGAASRQVPFYMERMLAWDAAPLDANLEELRRNAAIHTLNHNDIAALGVWRLLREKTVSRYGETDLRSLCVKIRLGLAYFLARDIKSANSINLSIRRQVLESEELPKGDFQLYLSNTVSEDDKQYPGQKIEHNLDFLAQLSKEIGERHPVTLSAKENLGKLYENVELYNEAYDIYLQLLTLHEETKGPAHPDSLAAKQKLADINRKRRAADRNRYAF